MGGHAGTKKRPQLGPRKRKDKKVIDSSYFCALLGLVGELFGGLGVWESQSPLGTLFLRLSGVLGTADDGRDPNSSANLVTDSSVQGTSL